MLLACPDVPLPAPAAVDRCVAELDRRLGPSKVDRRESTRLACSSDESDAAGRTPAAVVHAASTEDIALALDIAERHGVPVTPRAGGTGRTGGAVPAAGGIVLATASLSRVLEISRDDLLCVVEPGVVTADLHEAVEREGLFYPPDPNSLKTCMIGGNIAENAGGPRAFKYGVTREYVLGLEACLMGGRVLSPGRRTVKGVTGYDVTALLVGSEGTLGVFTKATLRLVRKPPEVATLLGLYRDVASCAEAVQRLIGEGLVPRCLELMDAKTLEALRAGGAAVDPKAGALLLAEVDGDGPLDGAVERLGDALALSGRALDVVVAQDAAQRARLWEARRQLSPATRKLARHKLSEDIVVPRSQLTALLTAVDEISSETGVRSLTYGHAGDGNLHVNFLWDDDGERPAVDDAIERLMRATVRLGGTLSGEHGIGIAKADYLAIEQAPELIALQEDIKRVFDPKGLLNPGKIFPSPGRRGHEAC